VAEPLAYVREDGADDDNGAESAHQIATFLHDNHELATQTALTAMDALTRGFFEGQHQVLNASHTYGCIGGPTRHAPVTAAPPRQQRKNR
jgi:hypothetical protein